MIEAAIGLLCVAAGLAVALGIADDALQLGGLAFLTGTAVVFLGALLFVHGLYREVRNRRAAEPHGLRTRALMLVSVACGLLIVVLGTAVFGQMTVSALPLGYHAVAEAVPLALFILYFAFKRKQARLDREGLFAANLRPEATHGVRD